MSLGYKNSCVARRSIRDLPRIAVIWSPLLDVSLISYCFQHSLCKVRVKQAQSVWRARVLYQQNSIDATIVLWVICHLGIFSWEVTEKYFSYNNTTIQVQYLLCHILKDFKEWLRLFSLQTVKSDLAGYQFGKYLIFQAEVGHTTLQKF